jgi:hypothetical protein
MTHQSSLSRARNDGNLVTQKLEDLKMDSKYA